MYWFLIILSLTKLAYTLTCEEVLELPEKSNLSVNQLQTIQPNEIVNCLSHLGRKEIMIGEAEFIWNTIVDFFNGITNIPEEVLIVLHYVSVAIQPEDLSNITMNNIDVISSFGSNYGLSNEQLEAIAQSVREDFGGKRPQDYSFYDLVALKQILCAFNGSEIERIHPRAYKEAASVIGRLKNCDKEVMQAFAHLAVNDGAFGSPSLWTNAIVAALGAVADYIPKEVVTGLKNKQGKDVIVDETI